MPETSNNLADWYHTVGSFGHVYDMEGNWLPGRSCKSGWALARNGGHIVCDEEFTLSKPPSQIGTQIKQTGDALVSGFQGFSNWVGNILNPNDPLVKGGAGITGLMTLNSEENKARLAAMAQTQLGSPPTGQSIPERALEYMQKHPGITLAAAVAAVGVGVLALTKGGKKKKHHRRTTAKTHAKRHKKVSHKSKRRLKFGSKAFRKKYLHKHKHGRR